MDKGLGTWELHAQTLAWVEARPHLVSFTISQLYIQPLPTFWSSSMFVPLFLYNKITFEYGFIFMFSNILLNRAKIYFCLWWVLLFFLVELLTVMADIFCGGVSAEKARCQAQPLELIVSSRQYSGSGQMMNIHYDEHTQQHSINTYNQTSFLEFLHK